MEDNSVTNILLMNKENCALKLVDEIILIVFLCSRRLPADGTLMPKRVVF